MPRDAGAPAHPFPSTARACLPGSRLAVSDPIRPAAGNRTRARWPGVRDRSHVLTHPMAHPEPKPRSAERSSAKRPIVLGILGGIASGKTAVARLLVGPQGVVIDA